MKTLTVYQERYNHLSCVTTLKDDKGFVKAIITGYQQPKRSQKSIVIRKETFILQFSRKKIRKE